VLHRVADELLDGGLSRAFVEDACCIPAFYRYVPLLDRSTTDLDLILRTAKESGDGANLLEQLCPAKFNIDMAQEL
jgi:hypothetical protein